jgi:glycosyltransferase involved in cell wall biosynthesis
VAWERWTVSSAVGQWPLVSVILPTRERPGLVRDAIGAVVGQDYPGAIECIVVHDQEPPDPSLARLGTDRHSVAAVGNDRSAGLAGARNTGIGLARGEFIASCDDDDTWHPAKLRLQIDRLLEEPDLLVVGSGIRLMLPSGRIIDWPARAEQISYQLLLRNRVKELHSSTLVMRRDAFARAGLYDEAAPYGYAEDYDWVLRAARVGKIGAVLTPLADIKKDAGSWYQGRAAATVAGLEYLLAKHSELADSRRGHARLLGQIAFARSLLGERTQASRYALKAVTRWPASPHAYVALAHIVTGLDRRHFLRVARLLRRGLA